MGTNYYLLKKALYDPETKTPSSFGCSIPEKGVEVLSNGFIFKSTYYPTLEKLNEVFYIEYHIGKSSSGWRFLLALYPDQGINSYNDWESLFNNSECEIYDEYQRIISAEEMINHITKRSSKGQEHGDRFLKDNHVLIGNNKFLTDYYNSFVKKTDDPNATFDCVISGNDPENGIIFS